MDSSLPNIPSRAAYVDQCALDLAALNEALISGEQIRPADLFRLVAALRRLKAETETLDQVLANMAQKKPA